MNMSCSVFSPATSRREALKDLTNLSDIVAYYRGLSDSNCREIRDGGGYYIVMLKENQKESLNSVKYLFNREVR